MSRDYDVGRLVVSCETVGEHDHVDVLIQRWFIRPFELEETTPAWRDDTDVRRESDLRHSIPGKHIHAG